MKKIFLASLLILALLCGCSIEIVPIDATTPTQAAPPQPEETHAPATEPTAATAAPTQTDAHIVYSGAVENFLEPVEEFSWEREHDPRFVMLHFTSAVVNNRRDPYNIDDIRDIFIDYDVSIHYIVGRDGTVHCFIPEDRVAWHAGIGTWDNNEAYTNKMNLYAIGIEITAIGTQEEMSIYLTPEEYAALDPTLIGYTDAQYEALAMLVADICSRYDIPMDRDHVIGHSEYSSEKVDPGVLLDWSRILP